MLNAESSGELFLHRFIYTEKEREKQHSNSKEVDLYSEGTLRKEEVVRAGRTKSKEWMKERKTKKKKKRHKE